MKENINEHDMTKKMMDVMRGGFKKLIIENEHDSYSPDYVIDIKPGTEVYNKQLADLQTVDVQVDITDFKIYPNQKKVKLQGVYFGDNNNGDTGVGFTFFSNDQEPEAKMQNINVSSEFWKSFEGFFATWCDEWKIKLQKEYPPKTNSNGL